jgi:hypothetical protein
MRTFFYYHTNLAKTIKKKKNLLLFLGKTTLMCTPEHNFAGKVE